MTHEILISAWETWDGSKSKYHHKHMFVESDNEAHAAGIEFALSLLDPYMNEIKHYAEYMAQNGYDYDDVLHQTMLECAHYDLWERYANETA